MAQIQMTLGWVIVYVDSPAEAAAFYEDTFGLRAELVVPGEYAQMDTGTTKLGFATYGLARGNLVRVRLSRRWRAAVRPQGARRGLHPGVSGAAGGARD